MILSPAPIEGGGFPALGVGGHDEQLLCLCLPRCRTVWNIQHPKHPGFYSEHAMILEKEENDRKIIQVVTSSCQIGQEKAESEVKTTIRKT